MTRHILTLAALSADDIVHMAARAATFAERGPPAALAGQVIGIWFRETSTRTRTAFTVAAMRMGAHVIAYGPDDLQITTGETLADTGRVLGGMLDGLVVRHPTGTTADLEALAGDGPMSVVNAMTRGEHPTQAIADLGTLAARFGRLDGLRLLYVGEGNNTATALALALARVPDAQVTFCTPPGYGLPPPLKAQAAALAAPHGAVVRETHDLDALPDAVDAVYGTRWQTTGSAKPDPGWRARFAPYRIDRALMKRVSRADGRTVFMHDLPAHRGEDVEAEVLDGPASVAFRQAHMKLYGAMAVLEWARGGG